MAKEITIYDDIIKNYEPKDIVAYVSKQMSTGLNLYSKAMSDNNTYQIGNVITVMGECQKILSKLSDKMNGGSTPSML